MCLTDIVIKLFRNHPSSALSSLGLEGKGSPNHLQETNQKIDIIENIKALVPVPSKQRIKVLPIRRGVIGGKHVGSEPGRVSPRVCARALLLAFVPVIGCVDAGGEEGLGWMALWHESQ